MLGKGLVLLESLAEPRSVSELAATSGLPKSTVHRLLATLRHDGWVAQNPDASYRRGWRWSSFTGRIPPVDELNGLVHERLQEFKERTDSTMGFSYFRGTSMLCDLRIQGDHEFQVLPDRGEEVPFSMSATGRVILGALPDPQMFRLIERERAVQGEDAEMDFPTVMHHIRRTRATGMSAIMKERAVGIDEPRPRVTCWAAVILDERRYPIGAVSAARVGPFLSEADNEKGIAQLFRLSHELTNLFGSDQVVVPPLRADWRILARPRAFGFAN